MAFDILTPKGKYFLSDVDWTMILKLAGDFGYTPKTHIINRDEFLEIVKVLRIAITSIPEDNNLSTKSRPIRISDIGNMTPYDYWSGDMKGGLEAFIKYCKGGDFEVEPFKKVISKFNN